MTPEEILRDLRDIHLPDQTTDGAAVGMVYWPLVFLGVFALLAGWFAYRRRSTWRRDIARHLDAIERDAGNGQVHKGWTDLATLVRRIAMTLCDKQDIAGLIGDPWLQKLDQLFQTKVFSQGAGRGLIVFPYQDVPDDRQGERGHVADQLRTTIADMRRRLPHLRVMR